MAKDVNVWITDWGWTDVEVLVPQARAAVRVEWVGDDGTPHEWKGNVTFPDDLRSVPVGWLKRELKNLALRAVLKRLGAHD